MPSVSQVSAQFPQTIAPVATDPVGEIVHWETCTPSPSPDRVGGSTPIWNRTTTPPADFESDFDRLVITLFAGEDSEWAPRAPVSFFDIVQQYSSRIAVLDICIDITVVEDLVRLPAGTFPHLHTLRLEVTHDLSSGDSLVYPKDGDPTITMMCHLAPRLSSFAFNEHAQRGHPYPSCFLHLLNIGFDFARLTTLDLPLILHTSVIHKLLVRATQLQTCNLKISDEEVDISQGKDVLRLPELRSLSIDALDNRPLINLFLYLELPALKTFELSGFPVYEVGECLTRSHTLLSTLRLVDLGPYGKTEITEFLTAQTNLTTLELSGCQGRCWMALWGACPILVPQLEHFVNTLCPPRDVPRIIALVEARIALSTPLRAVSLQPRFRPVDHKPDCPVPTQLQKLQEAITSWRARGIHVELDLSNTGCEDCDDGDDYGVMDTDSDNSESDTDDAESVVSEDEIMVFEGNYFNIFESATGYYYSGPSA
ncbi:hypothetical protein C8R46DRAFT_1202751 [Mycena filopes]|nr:hypothetical protein C8R46DRAFT_1202751 [Mycena filopes]